MIRKIWEDTFKGEAGELLGFSNEDTNQIIDLFIIDKINPQIFLSNLEILKYGVSAWNKKPAPASHSILNPPKTPSSISFWFLTNRPNAMPLWFIAAYPDVIAWWDEQQEKHYRDPDYGVTEFIKLFGIKDAKNVTNDKGKTRPEYLKNLVQSYKDATGKELETAIKNLEDGISFQSQKTEKRKTSPAIDSHRKGDVENKLQQLKKRILVVDDEENIRMLYQEELQEEGYEVETASDGIEALEMLANKEPFDLVTTCIRMPRMDGINLVREIKDKYLNLSVIIVTSYGEYKQDFSIWGADAYIQKSAELDELKDTIKRILHPEAGTENKLPQNTSIEKALPIMCVTNEYLWRDYLLKADKSLKFERQELMEQNGKTYDVLCFEKPTGEKVNLYFDISSLYGKGEDIPIPPVLNAPPHGITLEELYPEEAKRIIDIGKEMGSDLSPINVVFRQYSSELVSMHVAIWYQNQNRIEITPVRAYDKETGVPILHGYNFWRMHLDHQIQHIMDKHDVTNTETEIKGNYYKPVIGTDCIRFKPLQSFNFSNDLINYTFFTHRPNAFEDKFEVRAFGASLQFGFSRELFTLQEIEQAIISSEVDMNTRKALTDMANLAFEDVQLDREIEAYNKAIVLTPEYAEAYTMRGVTYYKKGRYDRAIEDYNKAIALNPNSGGDYNNRGIAYAEKGKYDEAIKDFNMVIALNPNNAEAYNNRGIIYDICGQLDRAIEDYYKAIALKPDYAYAYYNRGLAYHRKGQSERAISDFQKACDIGYEKGCEKLKECAK